MTHEIEIKVLEIEKKKVLKKLFELGAEEVLDTILKVSWYRSKGIKEGGDLWYLRIRQYGNGESEVTWKEKSSIRINSRKHKEINFLTEHPKIMGELFESIGLEKYAYQEKKRTSFLFKNWRFEIDEYPKMPVFLEIEGKSDKHIKEAIKILGLENNKTWAEGERTLIQKIYGLDWYKMKF